MEFIAIIILLIIVAIATIVIKTEPRKKEQKKELDIQFIGKEKIFTNNESSFLLLLDNIISKEYRIFGMVRIADIISVKGKNRKSGLNKITSKHIDYLVCRKKDLSILGAIELNDSSHEREDRKKRDIEITEIFKEAEIKLIFIKSKRTYDPKELKEELRPLFS